MVVTDALGLLKKSQRNSQVVCGVTLELSKQTPREHPGPFNLYPGITNLGTTASEERKVEQSH